MSRIVKKLKRARLEEVTSDDQCQAPTKDTGRLAKRIQERYLRLRPTFDPLKCQHEAIFEIQGVKMCRPHAGATLLKMAVGGKIVYKEG